MYKIEKIIIIIIITLHVASSHVHIIMKFASGLA